MYALLTMLAQTGAGSAESAGGTTASMLIVIASPFVAAGATGLLGKWSATKAAKIAADSADSAAKIAAASAENAARIAAESAAKDAVERSLARFHAEQCWQAKRKAYNAILRELHRVGAHFREFAHKCEGPGGTADREDLDTFKAKLEPCMRNALETFAAVGFFLPDEARHRFDQLCLNIHQGPGANVVSRLNACEEIVLEAITDFHAIARKDLGVK